MGVCIHYSHSDIIRVFNSIYNGNDANCAEIIGAINITYWLSFLV